MVDQMQIGCDIGRYRCRYPNAAAWAHAGRLPVRRLDQGLPKSQLVLAQLVLARKP